MQSIASPTSIKSLPSSVAKEFFRFLNKRTCEVSITAQKRHHHGFGPHETELDIDSCSVRNLFSGSVPQISTAPLNMEIGILPILSLKIGRYPLNALYLQGVPPDF